LEPFRNIKLIPPECYLFANPPLYYFHIQYHSHSQKGEIYFPEANYKVLRL